MRIVILHAGGLGDLILAETLLSGMRERYPASTIELVCREDVAPITSLYTRVPDAVIPFTFNPYHWALPTASVAATIKPLLAAIRGASVDLFISAELRATWLSDVLAAALSPRDAIIADMVTGNRAKSDITILLRHLALRRLPAVRYLPHVPGEHELDRYARLGGFQPRRVPELQTPTELSEPQRSLLVFPLGMPALKRWPLASFADAARQISRKLGLSITLVGSASERAELLEAVSQGTFEPGTQIVTGTPGELPRVAARIASARGYLAVDTGLAHLAMAFGIPGVTVYGGGTWPAYSPWRPSSAAVVAPIPCFGCAWDCAFDRPFCIEGIDVDSVVGAFDGVIEGVRREPLVAQIRPYRETETAILRVAAAVHRAAQSDRSARLTAITRVRDILNRYAQRTRKRDLAKREAMRKVAAAARAASKAARRNKPD